MPSLHGLKSLFDSRTTILFRRSTGAAPVLPNPANAGRTITYVVYSDWQSIPCEDRSAISAVFGPRTDLWARWLARPNYRVEGISMDGRLASFAIVVVCTQSGFFDLARSGDLILSNLNTLSPYRGHGLATQALDYICRAWQPGRWAYANTSAVENIASRKALERAAFERLGTYRYTRFARFVLRCQRVGE